MKLKFFVIGSCYSALMFKEKLVGRYASGNFEMVYHHQHDVFASIMSERLDVELSGVTSKYQWDFNHFASSIFEKNVIAKIKEIKPDYIVLDTYAEAACPVIKINEKTYVTNNYYISASSLYDRLEKERVFEVEDQERYELFKTYFSKFYSTIHNECPDIKFILVRTHSAEEVSDYYGIERKRFDYADKIVALNKRRDMYDKFVLEHISDIRCLDMTDKYEIASGRSMNDYNYEVNHNHYSVDYYCREYNKLQNIVLADLLGDNEKTRFLNQAVCITAYDDYPMLLLSTRMYKDFFKVYIQIDADSIGKTFTEEQIATLRSIQNVSVLTKYKAPKGSYNELVGMIELVKSAFSDRNVKYVHFVTNTDMPIMPVNKLYEFYDKLDDGSVFLNCHANGDKKELDKMAEYTYKYYFCYNEDASEDSIKDMQDAQVMKQKQIGICRNGIGEFVNVYKGVIGGSITREAYEYCMKYIDAHPEYIEDIKFARLRTELFWHTILFNAKEFEHKLKKNIRGSKFDFRWDDKKKDYAILDIDNYVNLKSNKDTFFVRKITSNNTEVINLILKDIGSPYKLEI